jgi:bifunctional DNA-binding transcriptional regulator/antitoxin component of YhaV-PrlF toxin-antitoxin module
MIQLFRILGKEGRITIPFEIRQRIGFSYNDVLSFTEAPDGKSVIVRREKICDNCKGTQNEEKVTDTITLFDFLNNLSTEQQRAALVHLSVKWAEKQGNTQIK